MPYTSPLELADHASSSSTTISAANTPLDSKGEDQDWVNLDRLKLRVKNATQTLHSYHSFLNNAQIDRYTAEMAALIHFNLKGSAPVFLLLYPHGENFFNRLTRKLGALGLMLQENFIDIRVENNAAVERVLPLIKLQGRTVVIVDMCLADGLNMAAAIEYCKKQKARTVLCASLIDMPSLRAENLNHLHPNFCGLKAPAQTLAGFGISIDGFYANEPHIWSSIKPQATTNSTQSILSHMQSLRAIAPHFHDESIAVDQTALAKVTKVEATLKKLQLIYDRHQVREKILYTSAEISEKFKDLVPVVICMQKGGCHFTTDWTEHLRGIAIEKTYMQFGRYGDSQKGGQIKLLAEPNDIDLNGREVIISEDLIEEGITIQNAVNLLLSKYGAARVHVVVFGDKPQRREESLKAIKPDFCCYTFDSRFLVGMGLDEEELERNNENVLAHPAKTSWSYGRMMTYGALAFAAFGAGIAALRNLQAKAVQMPTQVPGMQR